MSGVKRVRIAGLCQATARDRELAFGILPESTCRVDTFSLISRTLSRRIEGVAPAGSFRRQEQAGHRAEIKEVPMIRVERKQRR